jgi:hypothetical protein
MQEQEQALMQQVLSWFLEISTGRLLLALKLVLKSIGQCISHFIVCS